MLLAHDMGAAGLRGWTRCATRTPAGFTATTPFPACRMRYDAAGVSRQQAFSHEFTREQLGGDLIAERH